MRYFLFGLCIESDIALPHYPNKPDRPICDVVIVEGVVPTSLKNQLSPTIDVFGDTGKLLFYIPGIGRFLIENGCKITYQKEVDLADSESLRLFLLGSCMGALLQQRGLIVLHGNAVSEDGKGCQIFIGDSGAGKSTMAGWYFKHGALILADDVVALYFDDTTGMPMVIPSFPQIKLWQKSADLLGIDTSSLRRVRPQDEKYSVPIGKQFCPTCLPVYDVVEIMKDPGISKLYTGVDKLRLLQRHTYRYGFLDVMGIQKNYFRQLVKLVEKMSVKSCERKVL
jgi:hypothetical protein